MTFSEEKIHGSPAAEITVAEAPLHIKLNFLQRIYICLIAQLALTCATSTIFQFTPIVRFYVNENEWLLQVTLILLILSWIALLFKRNANKLTVLLLVIYVLLLIFAAALFVTYYDLLDISQAYILIAYTITMQFMYMFFSKKVCHFHVALLTSYVIIISGAIPIQMLFGCTNKELAVSVVASLCTTTYLLYSLHIVMLKIPVRRWGLGLTHLYIWPLTACINAHL